MPVPVLAILAAAAIFAGCSTKAVLADDAAPAPLRLGVWRAWVETPGGPLPFWLDLERSDDGALRAWMRNGAERVEFPLVKHEGDELTLTVDHYDSQIRTRIEGSGADLVGAWTRRRGQGEVAPLDFFARAGEPRRFDQFKPMRGVATADSNAIAGRWRIDFASNDQPAIGVFELAEDGVATGTILTTSGDYGYFEGVFDGSRLRLSRFDGAHAMLLDARVVAAADSPQLEGDFYSGAHWHDTWTARRDDSVSLPNAFELTVAVPGASLETVSFPDLQGVSRPINDPQFAGRARIIEIFGSWCPNCHDAAALLKELHTRYEGRGLSILGIAFEQTGDPARDAARVETYIARLDLPWPVLLGGRAEKQEASQKLPFLDRLRAYPTFVFVDRTGSIRAVYTGFSGPATGPAHDVLRERFTSLIEAMLTEAH